MLSLKSADIKDVYEILYLYMGDHNKKFIIEHSLRSQIT